MGIVISDILYCDTCKKPTLHEKRLCDVCCTICHSIAVTEHIRENCCIVDCSQKARYEIGDKNKPNSESTFVCEKHKDTLAYDWISDYNYQAKIKESKP